MNLPNYLLLQSNCFPSFFCTNKLKHKVLRKLLLSSHLFQDHILNPCTNSVAICPKTQHPVNTVIILIEPDILSLDSSGRHPRKNKCTEPRNQQIAKTMKYQWRLDPVAARRILTRAKACKTHLVENMRQSSRQPLDLLFSFSVGPLVCAVT